MSQFLNNTPLQFDKMHGLGNDFIVINGDQHPLPNTATIVALADRHYGIGFDQLLYVTRSHAPEFDFNYQIFNANGQEVEQCGNGVRCIAAFIKRQQLSDAHTLKLHCLAGAITASFEAEKIKVNLGSLTQAISLHTITLPGSTDLLTLTCLSLGNPHGVLFVSDIHTFDLQAWGTWLNQSPQFPEGINLEIISCFPTQNRIQLRVFERGVGETLACGSGACAAAIAACYHHKINLPCVVQLPGGDLTVDWQGGSLIVPSG